jgi:putative endonuclease
MARNRKKAERKGRLAEIAAIALLRFKGYQLLARRFKTHLGEIDLIMRRGNTTAFIEVKARATADDAIQSVTPYQTQRITRAAAVWIAKDSAAAHSHCRFDIVAVNAYLLPLHIENAFPGAQ